MPGPCSGKLIKRKVLLTCENWTCLGSVPRNSRSTFQVKKPTLYYPRPAIDGAGASVVPNAGSSVLLRTAQTLGLSGALRDALAPWRRPLARHDPGKIVLDLAVSLAIGGDCLADLAQLRAAPEVFGLVASDPTVSRLIDALAADAPAALAAINTARATARARAWSLAGEHAPDHAADASSPVVIDVDATLVTAHSEKETDDKRSICLQRRAGPFGFRPSFPAGSADRTTSQACRIRPG